jgi:biopolymer transport protein ExbB/TolQ
MTADAVPTHNQSIDPDIATLARVKVTVWAIIISSVLSIGSLGFAVRQNAKEIHEIKEKKADLKDNTLILQRIEALSQVEAQRAKAFDERLKAIEDFQRKQTDAAMRAAEQRSSH